MTQKEALLKAMKAINTSFRVDMVKKGINATGSLSKSLREEATFNTGSIYGNDYFDSVVFGKKPEEVTQSFGELLDDLLEWVETPKFDGKSPKEKMSIAFGGARNILRRGTLRGRSQKYPGLDAQQIIKREMDKIKPVLLGEVREKFLDGVRKG